MGALWLLSAPIDCADFDGLLSRISCGGLIRFLCRSAVAFFLPSKHLTLRDLERYFWPLLPGSQKCCANRRSLGAFWLRSAPIGCTDFDGLLSRIFCGGLARILFRSADAFFWHSEHPTLCDLERDFWLLWPIRAANYSAYTLVRL